ncbi:COG0727 Predicted Fe-S-cluster oxidoreductase [Comamonadaceae bacterium]
MSACTTCGACCACFRVEFSVYEMDFAGGTVPVGLAHEISGNRWRMNGTSEVPIRCTALTGTVGERVGCRIYALRPAPCHELTEGSEACARARSKRGLPALA